MKLREHWRRTIGFLILLSQIAAPVWGGLKWLLQWAENIDFLWSNAAFLLTWGGAVLNALLNPPSWISAIIAVAGLALIYWDSKRSRRETASVPRIQTTTVASGDPGMLPTKRYTGTALDARIVLYDKLFEIVNKDCNQILSSGLEITDGWPMEIVKRGSEFYSKKIRKFNIELGVIFGNLYTLISRHEHFKDITSMMRDRGLSIHQPLDAMSRRFAGAIEALPAQPEEKTVRLTQTEKDEFLAALNSFQRWISETKDFINGRIKDESFGSGRSR